MVDGGIKWENPCEVLSTVPKTKNASCDDYEEEDDKGKAALSWQLEIDDQGMVPAFKRVYSLVWRQTHNQGELEWGWIFKHLRGHKLYFKHS